MKIVEADKAFLEADANRHDKGLVLGQRMIDLREEKRSSGDRNFMERLKQLGVTYERARYWMDKVEGKETDRHTAQEKPAFDWDVAVIQLKALTDAVYVLRQSKPVGGGILVGPLTSLADLLGYQIVLQ